MSELQLQVFNIFLVAIEFCSYPFLASGFFPLRRKPLPSFFIMLVFFVVNFACLKILSSYTALKLLIVLLLIAVFTKVLYRNSWLHCFLLAALCLSLINIIDSAVLFSVTALWGQSMNNLLADPFSYYLVAYTAKILEVFVAVLVRAYAKKRFRPMRTSPQEFLRIAIFPTLTMVAAVILVSASFQYPGAAPHLFFCVLALLLTDIAAIALLNYIEKQQQAHMDSHILQTELLLAQEHIEALAASFSTERKLTHDFQNKLITVQGLLQQNPTTEPALDYLNELLKQQGIQSLSVTTRRPVADAILTQKYHSAQKKQIDISLHLDDLSAFSLPDDALVVVLSNLLDNAIEACGKIQDHSMRKIIVKAKSTPEESIICVENSVDKQVKIVGNRVSVPNKSTHHGYGLQNVSTVVESAGGSLALHCDSNMFTAVVFFGPRT